jgi:class 3 adenylate cyclase
MIERERGRYPEAECWLQQAISWFDRMEEDADAARVQLEVARTMAAAGNVTQLVSQAFLDALDRAEKCRREKLVRQIEEELRGVDEDALARHVFLRLRGRGVSSDTSTLSEGESEVASAMFLNLKEFIPYSQGLDPGDVMRTLNQMMADLEAVLQRHEAVILTYLGGGFFALARGPRHAERAVQAALDMIAVVEEFNRPRAVLGLRQLPVQIGIATGTVFLGNIGTFRKMEFTALGTAVNLASRLLRHTDPRRPCVSSRTYELVRDRYEFQPDGPRVLELPGLGRREAWDVIGPKKEPPHS